MDTISCNENQCDLTASHHKEHDIVMVTATTCSHCKTAKKLLKKQIDSNKIRVIDESSKDFIPFYNKFELNGVPTFIVDNEQTCDLVKDENPKLDCGDMEIDL